jgi:hypothetical protein
MAVGTELNEITYPGDDSGTTFPVGFWVRKAADVKVYIEDGGVETLKVLGVDYLVEDLNSNGSSTDNSTVTWIAVTPPATGTNVILRRVVGFTQDTAFRTQGSFSAAVHENAFDDSVYRDQQLDRRVKSLESAGAPGSVVAGAGLSFTGTTLNVGAGQGIVANANDVALDWDATTPAVTAVATGSAGIATKPARSDHRHGLSTAAAGAIAVGDAAADGVATSASRSDHKHSLAAPAAPANVTKATADAGAATTVARADHKHDVSTAAAIALTDSTNAEGSLTTLARSDHTHSHGARGGGTLHAAVTSGANGFMVAADKVLLDALTATRSYVQADNNVAQSIPHNVSTTILFALERIDTKGEYDPATGIFTATVAGHYRAAAQVHINATAADAGVVILNIVGPAFSASQQSGPGKNDNIVVASASGIFLLAVGETLKVTVTQTNAATAARSLTSSQFLSWFNINRLT